MQTFPKQPTEMQVAIGTVQSLMDSANRNSGKVLDRSQVQTICRYIMTVESASNEMFLRMQDTESMLAAYITEYGVELFNELTKEEEVADGSEVEAEIFSGYEGPGVDSPNQGDETNVETAGTLSGSTDEEE